MLAIIPYEHWHYAMLPVRPEQAGELERMGQVAGMAAELGPAFSAVEQDEDGLISAVLCCAGLAENSRTHATAWAAFGANLRPSQWSAITAAVRGVIEGADYARIDMLVRADFAAARRYAEALGFIADATIYARAGGMSGEIE